MKERFEATVEWLPFDLHPEYPPEGVPRNPERAARGAELFARYGLTYNPPPVSPRSLDAQRLAEHARAQGLLRAVLRADDGRLLGRGAGHRRPRRRCGGSPPRSGSKARTRSSSPTRYTDTVRRSTAEAHAVGINGIPAFLLDRRLLVLGAHPRETFERAFEQLGS